MSVTIFHNPRCQKSRAALAILREQGIEPEVIEYLKTPPTAAELENVLQCLNLGPRDVLRTGEEPYTRLGLGNPKLSHQALVNAMVANPALIERPIVIADGMAVVGRPPEAVLSLLTGRKAGNRTGA